MVCNKMEYYNLTFAVFYLWYLAITTLDKQSLVFFMPIQINNDEGCLVVQKAWSH